MTAPTLYTAISPRTVMDTRTGIGAAKAKLSGGGRVTLTIPGQPAGASAVTLNVTVTNPTAAGLLSASPLRNNTNALYREDLERDIARVAMARHTPQGTGRT